jgi:hypothetical protein
MLYAFGFDRLGVVVCDLFFADPDPLPGQESAERGVRLEVRFLERGALRGGIYSAQPIAVERPVWRCDLLESVDGPPGSFDRTHHHPRFEGWEPGHRVFVEALSADPLGWLQARLAAPEVLLDEAGVALDEVGSQDLADLRAAAPEIVAATASLLARVRAGELGRPAPDQPLHDHRAGWL